MPNSLYKVIGLTFVTSTVYIYAVVSACRVVAIRSVALRIVKKMKKSKKCKKKKSAKKEKDTKSVNSTETSCNDFEDEIVIKLEDVDELMETDVTVDVIENNVVAEVQDSTSAAISEPLSLSENSPLAKSQETSKSPNVKLLQKSKADKTRTSGSSKKNKKRDGSKGEDDTDSEEERWLDAIESGKLEEVDDELKRIKNPRLMTARQRALMEKRSDGSDEGFVAIPAEPLLALPSGFKEKVLTEEMLAKKAIKSKRRREQAQEKREEDKKKTVDRLLKKQDPKASSKSLRSKSSKNSVPNLTYINSIEGSSLTLPVGYEFPLAPQQERCAPKPKLCGVQNCTNFKKYSCSKTGIPLCSLECYKRNLISYQSPQLIT